MEICKWRYLQGYSQIGIRIWEFFPCGDGGDKNLLTITLGIGMRIMPLPYRDISPEGILVILHIEFIFIIFLIKK